MKCIAIIPARSGSKGIKDKNIKPLLGKPLMTYTIEAALKSRVFDEVMVSTDSIKYANIAKNYGAKVPFLRSVKNSRDKSSTIDTINEVLEKYIHLGKKFDAFCILQPTSPLRTSKNIKEAYNIFKNKADVAVVSVCKAEHMPSLYNVLPKDRSLDSFIKSKENGIRRQDYDEYYRLNGAIYFMYIAKYYKNSNFYTKGSYAYIMPNECSIDIDCMDDFRYAEYLLKNTKKNSN